MAVRIISNTIALPEYKKAVDDAVLAGIGDRPTNEEWQVSIFEPPDRPDYIITIKGPNSFRWKRDFFGQEQSPEFIENEVRQATSRPAPPDYDPLIEKLLRRSEEGRVPWEKGQEIDHFVCNFELGGPHRVYSLEIQKIADTYSLRMRDEGLDEIFSLSAEEGAAFGPWEKHVLSARLRDIFELARRKALAVDDKLAAVSQLLDAI